MKKQNLLTLLFTTTMSMSLICTPVGVYANSIDVDQYNTNVIASAQITVEPVIVFKGKSVTCGRELDRDMALEYLNKAKTSVNFNDITVMINVKEESSELIKGALLDLTKHDGETVALDYMHNGKVLKTLKLKVECEEGTLEFSEEASSGEITVSSGETEFDVFKYIDVEAAGGKDNIEVKITKDGADAEIDLTEPGTYKITYSLKNNPSVTKELTVIVESTVDNSVENA